MNIFSLLLRNLLLFQKYLILKKKQRILIKNLLNFLAKSKQQLEVNEIHVSSNDEKGGIWPLFLIIILLVNFPNFLFSIIL